MRLTTKLCLAYMLLLIIVGAVAGGMYYAKFPFLLYFIVPFAFFGAIGVLPGGFILFLLRIEGWKGRVALVAVCAVMLAAAYRAPAAYRAAHEPPCDQGPYLSWADDPQTSMTVSYTTATERLGAVLYGLAAEDKRQTQTSGVPPAQHHHITLTGLQPDTEYEYDVPALRGGPYRFKTAPAEPHDFSFFVYGDSRPWSGLTNHPAVIRAMRRSDEQSPVSFIISTGDIVENPGQGHGWQWRQFLRHITPFATTRPYLIGLGNHEARGGPERYEQYFDFGTVSSRNWYAFDYAGVHFVSLSTQDDTAPGSDQHTWLAEDLKAHAAESRFLVAFFHKPLRTYAPRESYRNPTVRENLLPLFEQYGVDIAFTGHVHAYEHHDLGALHHVVTGGGGVLLASTPVAGKETVQTETTHHFCRIDVTGDVLHMRAIRLDGSIIDEFTLHKRER